MLRGIVWAFLAILLLVRSAAGADQPRLDDPDRFANEVVALIIKGNFHEASSKLAETLGKPDAQGNLENAMKVFDGKKFDFTKKVIDKDFNGALRQIIHYAYIERFGFVYFGFNYKMTSRGWVLSYFNYKDSPNDLFPQGFVQGS